MNQFAEEEGYYVVYPAQSARNNPTKCWNWFRPADQCRDRGEPAIIAELTRHVLRAHRLDPTRVYVAGLSAGAAMAVILACTYPDIYAAAGIHSGLPYESAHDVPSAFAAMKQGSGISGAGTNATNQALGPPVPTIVFHGDRDLVVDAHNGDIVIAQSMARFGDSVWNADSCGANDKQVERGVVPGGYSYTRAMLQDPQGRVLAEQWLVHGAGHAWFGGDPTGSYTDPKGPDASAEMLRFFALHETKYGN
jgi:poly(hydroxyalkanoate) depolymerase family esterase